MENFVFCALLSKSLRIDAKINQTIKINHQLGDWYFLLWFTHETLD